MSTYIIISFALFFIIHFWFAQKIYSNNHFIIALLFSFILPFISYLHINTDEWIRNMAGALHVFIFVVLLFILKKTYKRINKILIKNTFVNKEYEGNDFTYVLWDSDTNIPSWWNEELASKPSWLDYFITVMLLVLPLLLTFPLKQLVDKIF